jgi:hypothetical protein
MPIKFSSKLLLAAPDTEGKTKEFWEYITPAMEPSWKRYYNQDKQEVIVYTGIPEDQEGIFSIVINVNAVGFAYNEMEDEWQEAPGGTVDFEMVVNLIHGQQTNKIYAYPPPTELYEAVQDGATALGFTLNKVQYSVRSL